MIRTIKVFKEKNPEHPLLKKIGAEPEHDKVTLPIHMGSMDKKLNKKSFFSKGDDYQILFTANSSKSRIISKFSKTLNIKISKIGKICSISQKSQIIDQKGKKIRLKDKGYYHQF